MDVPRIFINGKATRFPVIQGGMAVRISMAPLAAAVANTGGVGVIGASGIGPEELA
ncbi:MAG: nitronate monooxygenase, partial [Terriglobia bacterium]